jgi:hypothetical protein
VPCVCSPYGHTVNALGHAPASTAELGIHGSTVP